MACDLIQAVKVDNRDLGEWSEILAKVERRLRIAQRAAVVLQGSIAEGFGNSCSDIDLIFIEDSERDLANDREHLSIAGRRIEVWRRTVGMQRSIAARVNGISIDRADDVDADALHEYQQFCRSVTLRSQPFLRALRQQFSHDHVSRLVIARRRGAAERALLQSAILVALRSPSDATNYLQLAGINAGKAVVALYGENYSRDKCLLLQADRASLPDGLQRDIRDLRRASEDDAAEAGMFDACDRLLSASGTDAAFERSAGVARSHVQIGVGVQLVEVHSRAYLVTANRIHLLSSEAHNWWLRNFRNHNLRTLGELVTAGFDVRVLRELHQYGFVDIVLWPSGARWNRSAPVPKFPGQVWVSPTGAVVDAEVERHVTRLPFPATDFISAGAEVIWAYVVIDHCREDIEGAIHARQWSLVDHAVRRWALAMATILLAGHVILPLPDPTDLMLALGEHECLDQALVKRLHTLAATAVSCSRDAARARAMAEEAMDALPSALRDHGIAFEHRDTERFAVASELGLSWLHLADKFGVETSIIDGAVFPPVAKGQHQKGSAAHR